MRALLCILIPERTRGNIARLQTPIPDAEWTEIEQLSIPLFWLDDINSTDLIDLRQELELFTESPFDLTIGGIDITKSGQVYLQFNTPNELINKLRSALKVIKKQASPAAASRIILGTIPVKLKNKFIQFSIGYNETFSTEFLAIWEDGKYYFENGRFSFKIKPSGRTL